MKDRSIDCHIIEFESIYEFQVAKMITDVLYDQKVISSKAKLVDDEDLFKIPEVYKDRGRFWIALKNDTVIGTIAIRDVDTKTAKLNRMFVLTKYHGIGVGQELLNHALEFTKKQGFQEIILNTHVLMQRAHHFYEKNGFQRIGQESDKYHYKLIF